MGKFFASPVKLPKTELPQYCVHPTIYILLIDIYRSCICASFALIFHLADLSKSFFCHAFECFCLCAAVH